MQFHFFSSNRTEREFTCTAYLKVSFSRSYLPKDRHALVIDSEALSGGLDPDDLHHLLLAVGYGLDLDKCCIVLVAKMTMGAIMFSRALCR